MRCFLKQLRTIAASAMLLFVFTLGCGGCITGTPLAQLTSSEFQTYKNMLSAAVPGGCACLNYCNYMNKPAGEPTDCLDKNPTKIITLTDPTDNVAKQVRIGCFCGCNARRRS